MNFEALPWKDYLTTAAALLGAALGVLNTWNSVNQSRVRLRVRPSHAISNPDGTNKFCVDVLNLSAFPVTIAEVGFFIAGRSVRKRQRLAIIQPELLDGNLGPVVWKHVNRFLFIFPLGLLLSTRRTYVRPTPVRRAARASTVIVQL